MGDSSYVSMFNSILTGLCESDEIQDFGTKLINRLTDLLGMYKIKQTSYLDPSNPIYTNPFCWTLLLSQFWNILIDL